MNKLIHPIEPEELMAYLDGELTADRVSATASHLGECAECQGVVADLRSVSQNLKAWKVEPPKSATTPAIATALAENRPASRKPFLAQRRNWREILSQRWAAVAWVGAVAAILLLTISVPMLHRRAATDVVLEKMQVALVPTPPSSVPVNGRNFQQLAQLSPGVAQPKQPDAQQEQIANGPLIIRTADLSLITKDFDKARTNLEAILKRHRGYVGELKAGGSTGSGRTLSATLRVPVDQLDATLTEIKTLGRVESESQSGQDVTSQYVDLQARLTNARNTEQRLTDLLRNRTGKLSDVLAVEQELDRVRGEIEQMEAERKTMSNQVSFASLNATISEDYKAQLQVVPPSTSTRLSNAAVDGYRSMVDGVMDLALFLLSDGPSLLLWAAILFMPTRMVWKKVRRSLAA
jgi:hypothetical protein